MTMSADDQNHVARLLPAYLNGTLDSPVVTAVCRHLRQCAACRAELATWQAISEATSLAAPVQAPSARLLERVWTRLEHRERLAPAGSPTVAKRWPPVTATAEHDGHVSQRWFEGVPMMQLIPRRINKPIGAALAAAALAAALVLTPVGLYAQGFMTIFQPQKIVAVPLTDEDLKSLPDLQDYGTVVQPSHATARHFSSAAAAAAAAGLPVVSPTTLPPGLPTTVHYEVIPGSSGSFTFSAAKTRATAAAKGKPLPPMPANLDGSRIEVTTGPVVLAIYSDHSSAPSTPKAHGETASTVGTALDHVLIIGETTIPTVQSTGASAQEIEQYLLAQPGISPQLAEAIRAIGDPTTTLPIPIPVNRAASHQVQVQGVPGLAVADSTGVGGGVIWQKDGKVYGVAGTLPESQLIAVASSLH